MATAKTGTFYLTETVTLATLAAAGTIVQGTLDLSAYVNVPTGQAIAIDSVDFVAQNGPAFSGSVGGMLAANGAITMQLVDINPGTLFVRADNHSLIASGALNIDSANNIATHTTDLYPDNFGSGASLSESFMVVNDTLYLTAGNNAAAVGANDLSVSVRVRCRVVKLSTKDWMAIAIQSTAEA